MAAYDVQDLFTTADPAPVASPRTCEPTGTLTLVQSDGSFAISGGTLRPSGASGAAFGNLGVYGAAVTRALGKAWLFTWIPGSTASNRLFGFNSAQDVATTADDVSGLQAYLDGRLYSRNGGTDVGAYVAGVTYEIAIVLGGYDSNNVHWFEDLGISSSTYTYGSRTYIKGGTYTNWTLLDETLTNNTSPLYPTFAVKITDGTADQIDNWRVPTQVFTELYPKKSTLVHSSTWTSASNGDLSTFTPAVGSSWTERNSSDFDVLSSRLTITAVDDPAQPGNVATQPDTAANLQVEVVARSIFWDGDVAHGAHFGPIIRYSDDSNLWLIGLSDHADYLQILSRQAAVYTTEADDSVGGTVTTNTDYTTQAAAWGDSIAAVTTAPGLGPITKSSAFNKTATIAGIRGFFKTAVNNQDYASFKAWNLVQSAAILDSFEAVTQDTPELYGRPAGRHGQRQQQQLLAQ